MALARKMSRLIPSARDIPVIHERPEDEARVDEGIDMAGCFAIDDGWSYQLVRVSRLKHFGRDVLEALKDHIWGAPRVPYVVELSDESWEMLVLKMCGRELQARLHYIFPACYVDLHFNPSEPTRARIHQMGYNAAKVSALHEFVQRAGHIMNHSSSLDAAYWYRRILEHTMVDLPIPMWAPVEEPAAWI